jgi:hypothetical protein
VQPSVGFCSGERLVVFVVVLCWGCFEFGSVWRSVGLFGALGAFRLSGFGGHLNDSCGHAFLAMNFIF